MKSHERLLTTALGMPHSLAHLRATGTVSESTKRTRLDSSQVFSRAIFSRLASAEPHSDQYVSKEATGSTLKASLWIPPQSRGSIFLYRKRPSSTSFANSRMNKSSGSDEHTTTWTSAALMSSRATSMTRVAWPRPWPVQ